MKLISILKEIKVLKPNPYKPKTPEWWFHQLPEPYRKQALTNFKNQYDYDNLKNKIYNNLEDAVMESFWWNFSSEGFNYWDDLYNKLIRNEPLTEVESVVYNDENDEDLYPIDDESFKKGYKNINTKVDLENNSITTYLEALPKFDEIRRKLLIYRKEFQPFKYSSNPEIAKLSKDINTMLTKVNHMIFALDKMIELYKKQ